MPNTADSLSHSLPRTAVLRQAGDFSLVFKKQDFKAWGKAGLILAKTTGHPPRLGMVVSKKALKRAVDRNRVKRIMRESFRLRQHQLPECDYVYVVSKNITQNIMLDNATLHRQFDHLWRHISKRKQPVNRVS